ncbi:glutathione S-transferase-like protein [Gloeopeniophorella convolvens]|nr:glutathione S-transferase-like protein [Gloeopeniophorella convolvens]
MAFKLYGVGIFSCTRRVALIAKERGVPYELIPVGVKEGEHKSAAYLEHQPFGQVPYILQEDGFELYESRAIGRYVATLGSGPELIPSDPKARAKFEQAASIEYSQFDPAAGAIINERIFKPFWGKTPDQERLDSELVPSFEAKLDAYEAILSKQKYLAGDEVTLADLYHLPYGAQVFSLGYGNLGKRPNVQRWWDDISSRPSWEAVKDSA